MRVFSRRTEKASSDILGVMSTTLMVSEETVDRVQLLASQRGSSVPELIARALDALEARESSLESAAFWSQAREALASNPEALEPDAVWERSTGDNLDVD